MKVLDHGFVELVETWGSDERIIEAARESTDKGFLGWGPMSKCANCGDVWEAPERECPKPSGTRPYIDCGRGGHRFENLPGDEKLLRFLHENAHSTPFEFAGAVIRIQAPIFVFREWHRHRTQSYSEISARYTPLPDVNYIPSVERLMLNAGSSNRQAGTASGARILIEEAAELFRFRLQRSYAEAQELYNLALADGVPKELARVHLPVGRYSRMRAQANLRNWLAFLTLREAPNAQWEIRQYAHAVSAILKEKFPRTHALYAEGRRT